MSLPRTVPLLIAALAMALTGLTTVAIENGRRTNQQLKLQADADELAAALAANMTGVVFTLQSSRAMFTIVDREYLGAFRTFVKDIQDRHAMLGVRGIGFILRVKDGNVAEIERWMQANGEPDFHVWPRPVSPGSEVYTVVALEPDNAANRAAIGFNPASEAKRYAALQSAAKSGAVTTTPALILLYDQGRTKEPGFLAVIPIYRPYFPEMTAKERAESLVGFVYSPVRIAEQVAAVRNSEFLANLRIALADGVTTQSPVFYDRGKVDGPTLTAFQTVRIVDRDWRLTLAAPRGSGFGILAITVLAFGTALSLLLGALTALIVQGGRMTQAELLAKKEYEGVRNVLARELTHRVKNTLATVIALAMLSKRDATNLDDYVETLSARLQALSATNDLLTHTDWSDAQLRAVLESEFAPFRQGATVAVELDGPDVLLKPNIAVSFGMAIHELITNAAKYGSLSVPGGKVSVRWSLSQDQKLAMIDWRESNGPEVVQPSRRSFGSDLIERLTAHEIGSKVTIVYDPGGVRCTMFLPVQRAPSR